MFPSGQGLKKKNRGRKTTTITTKNKKTFIPRIYRVHSGSKLQTMEFHSSYLSYSLFFQVSLCCSCGFVCCPCASIISSPQIEKVTWLITSNHRGLLLPTTIFGACVSGETGASSQYTGVVMGSGDIWGRRCSPTASSIWGIHVSMTCSVWMFPSSPVGQGQPWPHCFGGCSEGPSLPAFSEPRGWSRLVQEEQPSFGEPMQVGLVS